MLAFRCPVSALDCLVQAEVPDGNSDKDVVFHGCSQYADSS